jgi:hypothetical protein
MTHERRKLTPDYDEGSLEDNGLHSDPKKSPEKVHRYEELSYSNLAGKIFPNGVIVKIGKLVLNPVLLKSVFMFVYFQYVNDAVTVCL